MTLTPSAMLELGTLAPEFSLINTVDQRIISLREYAKDKPVVILFMCNHCPYILHIIEQFNRVAKTYQQKGIAFIGISANDINTHPQDAPEHMHTLSKKLGLCFPYCFDETQEIAKAYHAVCTPDLYLFNTSHHLVYRGRFDDSTPGNDTPVTGKDLTQALDLLLADEPIPTQQHPSIGCNIKWTPPTS